ncbi:MAG: N-6 DNA methylase [Bacteroidota bacterium]
MEAAKQYQAFYTDSEPIIAYMIRLLQIRDSTDVIFEPCAGEGVFIDAILAQHPQANIEAYELNPTTFDFLKDKYIECENLTLTNGDTLLDLDLYLKANSGGWFDRIIANPPYGAWRAVEKRKLLKKHFPGMYVKESYSLFLYQCIQLLRPGGRLVFIIPDTWLNLRMHKMLRKTILTETNLDEISLFPSSYFPGVNFGYANLSIVALTKNEHPKSLNSTFTVRSEFKSVFDLPRGASASQTQTVAQADILNNPDFAFLLSDKPEVSLLIRNTTTRVGDIANCVTGFYSGNDKQFLKVISKEVRNAKPYGMVNPSQIADSYGTEDLQGISGDQFYVPIVKGGGTRFLKPNEWYMDWSVNAVCHYKNDKKARFQNPSYYFRDGIGVPMVSSRRLSASLIGGRLFDQSIVGVFPQEEEMTLYLLGYFNSLTCNTLLRTINPSANNPANYLKKIPIMIPESKEIETVGGLVKEAVKQIKVEATYSSEIDDELDRFFRGKYGF